MCGATTPVTIAYNATIPNGTPVRVNGRISGRADIRILNFQLQLLLQPYSKNLAIVLEPRRGSRISARGGRQRNDDLIWDGNERFLTYANTDLQFLKMFIAILCLNGVEQPFKRHQCPFFLLFALETREPAPSARVLPSQGWAPAPAPRMPTRRPGSAPRTISRDPVNGLMLILGFYG